MMEEKVASGVQNKRPMKKNKKKWLKRVFDYLKSDSYMFAPLIFHPTNSAAAPECYCGLGVAMTKPIKEGDRTLLEKVGEYLKSDNYMYAPLIITQPMHVPALKAIKSPQTGYIKSISTEISTRKITKKINQPTEQPARRQTYRHQVMVKHMVHQNCRSSVLSEFEDDDDGIHEGGKPNEGKMTTFSQHITKVSGNFEQENPQLV